ncbi:hypothetical protein MAR_017887 [Mya arenaria]|uniref:Kazal-like domain-containing protein n=1 Tax=Mya arenaria TaxID=6604 RepID=A0ABY7EFS1_MYAAR|nr:hypothetical protein MAR_017887 [Mya arenaria]
MSGGRQAEVAVPASEPITSGDGYHNQNLNHERSYQPALTCECTRHDIDPVCTTDGQTEWFGCLAICLGKTALSKSTMCPDGLTLVATLILFPSSFVVLSQTAPPPPWQDYPTWDDYDPFSILKYDSYMCADRRTFLV